MEEKVMEKLVSVRSAKSKRKKILIILSSIIILIPIVIIICISPITKYLVEKYSVKYIGRQVKMDWAYVNPFTGYAYFKNLKINEFESDSIFISANGASATFSLLKLFSRTCEITQITLDQPNIIIIESQKDVNFYDLIQRFKPKDTISTKSPFHVNVLNMKIVNGVLRYRDNRVPVNYSVVHLDIESPGLQWNMDTLAAKVSLLSGNGAGGIKGHITINLKNLDYKLDAVIDKLELEFLNQYLKTMSNYGSFRANLDADIKANGSFKDAENMEAKGQVVISDFHFGEDSERDFASFEKFTLRVNALNPKNKEYLIDSVSLSHPYFKFEQYDYLNNVERMFEQKGEAVQQGVGKFNLIVAIGNYIKELSQNFFRSNYTVTHLAVYNGDFLYDDFSLNEKFAIAANPVYIRADSIKKTNSRVKISFNTGIKPYGSGTINLSVDPQDSSDFDLNYNLKKIPISIFNPYLIAYTSFPLDMGTLELNGTWKVREGVIQSDNHLLVIDPRIGQRVKNKNNHWLPMRLAMFLIKEEDNVIDYQIPITGNLKSPSFHLHEVVMDIIRNIFVKPATSVYRTEVKNREDEIEQSMTLKWETRQFSLSGYQRRFLDKTEKFLEENPTSSVVISPELYEAKEKEGILFYEAKKKYYLSINQGETRPFSEDDSEHVERMSIRDSMFIRYLNKHLTHALEFTLQDKCTSLIGVAVINTKFNQLTKNRKNAFLSYFKDKDVGTRVKFSPIQNNIPYNGFSYYKIEFKGELPDYLIKAYAKMAELNTRSPREKYSKERKSIL
jgi:uncharacterized protein DUF748